MNDFISLLMQAIEQGTMEITIKVRYVPAVEQAGEEFKVTCASCSWTRSKSSSNSAARALRAHHRHCKSKLQDTSWIAALQDATKTQNQ